MDILDIMIHNASMLSPQGNREEGYEVDEDLAEQDATALFEVTCSAIYSSF